MDGTADDTTVAETVQDLLGARVTEVTDVAGSVVNRNWLVRLDDRRGVAVKAGPWADLAREGWVCRHLRERGLAVPEVLALERAGASGAPVLVTRLLDGAPTARPAVLHEAGRMLRQVHAVGLEGFGPLVVDGDGAARGAAATPDDALARAADGAGELVAAGVLDAPTVERAVAVATGDLVRVDGPGVLLHGDLKTQHVFGQDDVLTGVIDWGDARVGDPLLDLARLSMARPAVFAAVLSGYAPDPVPDLERRLAAHRVAWDLRTLVVELRAGGDWFDVYRDRLRADLGRLDEG